MFLMLRISSLGLVLSFCLPRVGLCDIWQLTRNSILKNPSQCSYEKAKKYLELLTPSSNISVDSESEDILIANGAIVLNPESIRSYRSPSDYREKKDPEFEFRFSDCLGIMKEEQEGEVEAKPHPKKVSFALDLIPSHKLFKDRQIGSLMYDDFIRALQDALRDSLISKGFSVDIIRPKLSPIEAGPSWWSNPIARIFWWLNTRARAYSCLKPSPISVEAMDEINSCAPTIVLSTQFNDDKQDDMTVFCAGGISGKEFTYERQRARFIQSALTSKHFNSVELGACLIEAISEQLKVKPLDWGNASFASNGQANAFPVSCSTEDLKCAVNLEKRDGNFNGIAMRNLFLNGIYANAVVILFPDMKWVMEQVKSGEEMEWISRYVNAITDGVQKFMETSPLVL